MPQVIPEIVKQAAVVFSKVLFSVGGVDLTVGTVAKIALAAGSYSYSRSQAKRALRSIGSFDKSRTVTIRESDAPRRILYGEMRMGGTLVFAATSGTNNEYLHLVIAHCEGPCEAIGDVYLNDEVVPLDGSGNATGKYAGYVTVKKHLGSTSQTVDTDLQTAVTASVWSNNHRLQGICYSYVRLKHNPDLFPSGLPNYSAVIQGRNDIYDPRDLSTGYTTNSALCLRHYLVTAAADGGLGASSAEIDDDAFEDAANVCDESVDLNPSGTESRYTTNGIIDLSNEPAMIIEGLCSAMAGICPYVGGTFKPKAGAHTASVFSFTEDDIVGPVQFSTRDSLRDAFNGVKGTYVTEDNDFQVSDFPPVVNSTYTTEDGGSRIWRDIALPFTTSSATAQRLAKIELERGRQDIVVTFETKIGAIDAHVGDVVDLTLARYGWSGKLFEITNCAFLVNDAGDGATLGLRWTLRETASGLWDWNSGEETTIDLAPNTNLIDPATVPNISGFTATDDDTTQILQPDGTFIARVRLSWNAPTDQLVLNAKEGTEIQYKKTADSTWLRWNATPGDIYEDFITDLSVGVQYDFRARHRNELVGGAWATVSAHTVGGDTTAPAAPSGLTAQAFTGFNLLQWTAPADKDVRHFNVYRHTADVFGSATLIGTTPATNYQDAEAAPGTTYYYWVTAEDKSDNEGNPSSSASVETSASGEGEDDGVTPDAVSSVSLTGALGLIVAEWTNPTNTTRRRILIYVNSIASKPSAPTHVVDGGQHFFFLDGLGASATRYLWFEVEARNGRVSTTAGPYNATTRAGIDLSDLGTGLTMVEIVGTLPTTGNFDGRTVFLTTDKKIYRYSTTAVAFTVATDGADIVAGTILAGAIAAGAITATHIGANEIIANAANIADAIITSAKIASLAAAKVDAGNLTAVNVSHTGRVFHESYTSRYMETIEYAGASQSHDWGTGTGFTFTHDTGLRLDGPGNSGSPIFMVRSTGVARFLIQGRILSHTGNLTIYYRKNGAGSYIALAAVYSDDGGNAGWRGLREISGLSATDYLEFFVAPCNGSGDISSGVGTKTWELEVDALNW